MAASNNQINADRPAAAGAENEEQAPAPMNFMTIMNWIFFFFMLQSFAGMITSKFIPPPPSPPNNDAANMMMPSSPTGSIDGNNNDGGVVQQQTKPLGVNPIAEKSSSSYDVKKVKRMMKPACFW